MERRYIRPVYAFPDQTKFQDLITSFLRSKCGAIRERNPTQYMFEQVYFFGKPENAFDTEKNSPVFRVSAFLSILLILYIKKKKFQFIGTFGCLRRMGKSTSCTKR